MKSLDQARAVVAAAHAKHVLTDPMGRIVVSPTSTHLLARRALGGVWA